MKKLGFIDVRLSYVFMTGLVFVCAFEYILIKPFIEAVSALTFIWMKYLLASIVLCVIKLIRKERWPFKISDIPYFLLLALAGEFLYYMGTYNAVNYLPVALVTVVIALCPVLSIVFERIFHKKKIRLPAVLGICVSLFGISLVAGVDIAMFASGRILGYLLAFGPVVCVNIYNFTVIKLTPRYSTIDIALYVVASSTVISFPIAIGNMPEPSVYTASFFGVVLFLGLAVAVFGSLAYVNSVKVLGPTTTLLFSNFVPVVTCVFGWLLLGETIMPLQLLGGAITLIGCASVIWLYGKTLPEPVKNLYMR